ncbi:MAG: DUF2842 domain-containing protein [Thermaurantiacus tibetensis]|uniref:DUF2842 domain-containing protein n=1 Tax=Thermaurantiacus tibetensis TaxID=2759035 RepID=UPI0018909D01|nr:DUF2842 domain-containing protein [Thermaurantiacus tibetensis]
MPSLRRPLGIIGLVLFLFVYALGVVRLAEPVATLHPLVQLPIWLVLGLAWVIPFRPVLVWMETGRWRTPR